MGFKKAGSVFGSAKAKTAGAFLFPALIPKDRDACGNLSDQDEEEPRSDVQ